MADPKALEFLQRAEQDPELRGAVEAVGADDRAFEELAKIAQRAGYSIDAEAIQTGLRECSGGELDDEQLDGVTGGSTVPCNLLKPNVKPILSPTITKSSAFVKFVPKIKGVLAPCD